MGQHKQNGSMQAVTQKATDTAKMEAIALESTCRDN
jgi:hypothetical protein